MLKYLARAYAEKCLNDQVFNKGLISEDMFIQVDKVLLREIDEIERQLSPRGVDNAITSNEATVGKR